MKYEMSVVVVTYYPDYNKLFQTLYSIVIQKDISLEIIISDDGTPDFDKAGVEKWMKEHAVSDYKILTHENNQGTVKNIYDGVSCAEGRYVKGISPGDYLYSDDVLRKIYDFMWKRQSKIGFGRAVYYAVEQGKPIFFDICNPRYLKPYRCNNLKQIQKAYLIYKDYVLGASLVCETECFRKYLEKIKNRVVYAEDCAIIWMVADGIVIDYIEIPVIWYEYGSGISTQSSDKWKKRLYNDNKSCFEMIIEEHPEWKGAYDRSYCSASAKRMLYWMQNFCRNKTERIYRGLHKEIRKEDEDKLICILNMEQKIK